MAGLPAEAIARMHGAARAIRDGALSDAERLLASVLAQAPEHPEAMRLLALLHGRRRDPVRAVQLLK
ncbi:MAG: tetratricopeptide repeat protein, partial [Luteimonas sp.]